jgi:hypothetical protein
MVPTPPPNSTARLSSGPGSYRKAMEIGEGDALGKETRAFTSDGIDRLKELLEEHEENLNDLLRRNQWR